ncbi:MAG: hypothetical protein MSS69_11845 [Spirochaetales bacterium]|nr:hypothetical protein [Spirochaetales bacterium]
MDEGLIKKTPNRGVFPKVLVSIAMSLILLSLEFTSLIYTLPIMAFVAVSRREDGLKVFLPTALILILRSLYYSWGMENLLLWVCLDLYVPLSLLVAGYIWTISTGRLEKRLFLSILPAFLATILIGLVFFMDRALFDTFYMSMKDAFAAVMENTLAVLGIEADIDFLFLMVSVTVGVFALPTIVATACVSFFYYESRRHSRETALDDAVAAIELNTNIVWILILALALFLLGRFISMPLVLSMAFLSLVVTMLLVYSIQGFSVLMAWIKNGGVNMKSTTLFIILLMIGLLMPGLNIVVLIGLPVIGLIENFFNIKTRRKK